MHAYITARGGLGDLLWWYCNHPEWRKVESIKAIHPTAKIDVVLLTCNSNAASFLARNPHYDEIRTYQTEVDGSASQEAALHACGALPLSVAFKLQNYDLSPVAFYLDKEEQEIAKKIIDAGPYCVLHPYGGDTEKSIYGRIDLAQLVLKIVEKGFTVVVVGGDSIRQENCRAWLIREEFSMEHPRLFNLVNWHTPRLAAYLTWNAARFVGSFSCYNIAAIYGKVKGVAYCHPSYREYFATMDTYFKDVHSSNIKVLFYDEGHDHETIAGLL